MKTKIINYMALGLLGLVLACRDKAEPQPQPDWASKWQGVYYMDDSYDSEDVPGGINVYCLRGLLEVEKKDNSTVRLNFYGRAYIRYEFGGGARYRATFTLLNPLRSTGITAKAISENTLQADETNFKDEKGNTLLNLNFIGFRESLPVVSKQDSITGSYRPSFFTYWRVINNKPINFEIASYKISEIAQPLVYISRIANFLGVENSRGQANFYALGSDALVYRWDFGDGSTGEGETISHVYTRNGTYTVKLRAVRPNGQTLNTQTSTVISDIR
jgi:hypothetical protein